MTINDFHGENNFLSNFYPCKIRFEGFIYPSVEHAYVAAKTTDIEIRKQIQTIPTAGKVKRFGRTFQLRSDWTDDFKLSVMENFLRQKFSDPSLKEKLLSTSPEELVEGNTWGDVFWGVCKGSGANHLGKLLMKIRDEQQSPSSLISFVKETISRKK